MNQKYEQIMMLGCGVIWMLRTTCMVRKDREQIQEGMKGVIKMIWGKEKTKKNTQRKRIKRQPLQEKRIESKLLCSFANDRYKVTV